MVMHARDDRSRMLLFKPWLTHEQTTGAMTLDTQTRRALASIQRTACDCIWEGVLFLCARAWYVGVCDSVEVFVGEGFERR